MILSYCTEQFLLLRGDFFQCRVTHVENSLGLHGLKIWNFLAFNMFLNRQKYLKSTMSTHSVE